MLNIILYTALLFNSFFALCSSKEAVQALSDIQCEQLFRESYKQKIEELVAREVTPLDKPDQAALDAIKNNVINDFITCFKNKEDQSLCYLAVGEAVANYHHLYNVQNREASLAKIICHAYRYRNYPILRPAYHALS